MKFCILAGGSGSRLWPLSREMKPKQFIKIYDGISLLEGTLKRFLDFVCPEDIYIVSKKEHFDLILQQCKQYSIGEAALIEEPEQRNTAPALSLTMRTLCKRKLIEKGETVFFLPADHFFEDDPLQWEKAILRADQLASKDYLVTFGITPQRPETAYGYIEADKENSLTPFAFKCSRFIEKPKQERAEELLRQGNFYWNAGIFAWNYRSYLNECIKHSPEHAAFLESDLPADFKSLSKTSIDYELLEKSQNIVVLPLSMSWHDLGSHQAIYNLHPKDEKENVILGDVILQNAKGNFVQSSSRLVTAVDVEDLIIIETENAVFVSKKHSPSSTVRDLVEELKNQKREEVFY